MNYKNKDLEEILVEKDLLNNEKTGFNHGREDEAREVVMQYIKANSGFPNNLIIRGYWFMKSERFTKGVDSFLETVLINNNKDNKKKKLDKMAHYLDVAVQTYLGGSMNRKDQKLFALTAEKEAWKITVNNAWMTIALSPQYIFFSDTAAKILSPVFPGIDGTYAGLVTTGILIGGNFVRMYLAKRNKQPYAGFSLDGLVINVASYWKRRGEVGQKIRKVFGYTQKNNYNGTNGPVSS